MKKFDAVSKAVFDALPIIGDLTSGKKLVAETKKRLTKTALQSTDAEHLYSSCIQARLEWRKANGKAKHDSRTHATQFRRNMLNDEQFTTNGLSLFKTVIKASGPSILTAMLNEFHSIDQIKLLLAINDLVAKRAA